MTFDWKKYAIILADGLLAVYLLLAVTAFNRPDESSEVCNEVNIHIEESIIKGFLKADDIKVQLQRAHLYPLGDPLSAVDTRKMEDALRQNPFVKEAQVYKSQTGHVYVNLTQRLPIIRVKADNGEDYYLDELGNIMPNTHFVSDLAIATGPINHAYAKKTLTRVGRFLAQNPLWSNQVEQLNVLSDGSMEMVPRVGDHIVYLGRPVKLDHKFARLEKFYRYGLSKAGWNKYSYSSLEFDNQIICKKRNYNK